MITMQEMEKELAIYRKNFTAVRLISEADILRTIEARKHNPASRACPCRDGRMTSQGCRNCIVLRAYMEKCKKIKLEYDDPNVYQVTARYLHVEGGRYVLELVQNAKLPAPNVLLLRAYSSGCKAKGSDNMTGAMLKDLGAINIADADDSLLENLSMENIIADDPEDIFVVTMGASQQKALDWLAENLQANPAWSGLSAVQSGHYYLLDKALFHYKPNARWGESYRTLAALLYPQLADQLEALA